VSLPLCYCTNVHPCRSAAEVERVLDDYAVPVRQRAGFDIAVGLWLPAVAVDEVQRDASQRFGLRRALDARGLTCHTLNAFPFGDFHDSRVKEQVYLPDWADPRRLDYTAACAGLLADLLPEGVDGSISTLPLGFKLAQRGPGFLATAIARLLDLATHLARIRNDTGRTIRLAIEPEPFCLLETTAEVVDFFRRLWEAADAAGTGPAAREHLGVCYDVCHQAVEFEDAATAVGGLREAGIRINKVQISCAIQLDDPADAEARAALAAFAEPRYLHQTMARAADGRILRAVDLSPELASSPPDEWREARPWRTHFHVPVDAERLGPLGTTRAELRAALAAVAGLDERPHLEVETYTWPVLPGVTATDMVDGLARELVATRDLLATLA
jgi:sugar phosphate isomerase/epimerase